jgi:CRISPR-associated protein Csm5
MNYKARLHIISPTHIGSGEVYEPTSFWIEKGEKTNKLIEFNELKFIESLTVEERNHFNRLALSGTDNSLIDIMKFINKKEPVGRKIGVFPELVRAYDKIFIDNRLKDFAIERTSFLKNSSLPYIPGSSIKGSIRTAYLNKLAKTKGIKNADSNYKYKGGFGGKKFEGDLLEGTFNEDPFRMIKISDFLPVEETVRTHIMWSINQKRDIKKNQYRDARNQSNKVETIVKKSIFEGTINIDEPHRNARIINPINKEELLSPLNHFSLTLFNNEINIIKSLTGKSTGLLESVQKEFYDTGKLGESAFLLKIGRYSGSEAMTIENNRSVMIKVRNGPNRYDDKSTLLWMASDKLIDPKSEITKLLRPFGWCVLELIK